MARHAAGRLSRRQLGWLLGVAGLSAASVSLLTRGAAATSSTAPSHGMHSAPASQEGPPAATPVLGDQADGGRVWRVIAGGGDMAELIEAVAFYPEEITINAGDAIFFEIRGFHNVHFLSGAAVPSLVIPDPDLTATPTAGGPPTLILNPEVALPVGGTSYDGTGIINSGLPLDPNAPPFVLTFTTPGTYDYVCSVHLPEMTGRVVVQDTGGAYPMEQADYDRMGEEALAGQIEAARTALERYDAAGATPVAAGGGNVHEVTAGFLEGPMDVLRFAPESVSIKAGDTVRWVVRSAPVTPHIVTFLGDQEPPEFIVPEMAAAGPPKFVLNPMLVAPAGDAAFVAGEFLNSGLLGGPDGRDTYELTFDAPGTYAYYCPIHASPTGGMIGEVVVE